MPVPYPIVTGIAAPMRRRDVNTDDIFPVPTSSPVYRCRGKSAGSGVDLVAQNAFAVWRYDENCVPHTDFVLNKTPFDRAQILLAYENFGCGSSREFAVWALKGAGLRCIIAPSFGDIFYNNCIKNGLLPVRLPLPAVELLMDRADSLAEPLMTVDLNNRRVYAPGLAVFEFDILQYHQELLSSGVDEIDLTLKRMSQIAAFERAYHAKHDWLLSLPR